MSKSNTYFNWLKFAILKRKVGDDLKCKNLSVNNLSIEVFMKYVAVAILWPQKNPYTTTTKPVTGTIATFWEIHDYPMIRFQL